MIKNKVVHTSISNILSNTKEFKEVFVLFGILNNVIIPSSIKIIESKLNALGYSKSLVSRAKLISVELLENIIKHQATKYSLEPYFELSICNDEMKFVTGNSVTEKESGYLKLKLNAYANMTTKEIQEKYIKKLQLNALDERGNAGLGLLTILKRSKKKYAFNLEKIKAKEYYFNSTITIASLS